MANKYYVTMTDKFMSNWGMAQGKINKLVIVCDTYEQAYQIKRKAEGRKEMKYINITTKKPYFPYRRFYTSWKNYEEMTGWH